MRILFLTQIIPFPPDAGPKVKTWHVLRYLVEQGHQVILASFVRPEERQYLPNLEEICERVYPIPIRRSRVADIGYWLRSNLTGRPFLVERDDSKQMRELVNQLVREEAVDIIHADQLTMAQFAMPPKETTQRAAWPTTVFDAHNAVWTIVERMKENASWFLKPVLAMEASRTRQHEGQILHTFDHILAVTEPDRRSLLEALPAAQANDHGEITVIPIAVDTQQLLPTERESGSTNILTMGTLHYPPNADGIRWFAKEVFPLIEEKVPSASLTIIGKNPPADFLQLASEHPNSIQVTGYVPELTPYMEKAALMVVPVRAGGGMRVRILEGFARAMPQVTTTIGLEGIEAQPDTEVLVKDTEATFAQAVIDLLEDPELQTRLANNGRKLAVTEYDWQVVLSKLGSVYERIHQNKQPTA